MRMRWNVSVVASTSHRISKLKKVQHVVRRADGMTFLDAFIDASLHFAMTHKKKERVESRIENVQTIIDW